jgi:hypothetical protein
MPLRQTIYIRRADREKIIISKKTNGAALCGDLKPAQGTRRLFNVRDAVTR